MKITMTLLMLLVLFLPACSKQPTEMDLLVRQRNLPEGAKARLGKGHITGNMAYSADGTRLAVAISIGIWIYDTHTGEELALFSGHRSRVLSVSFSPDGFTLASGSGDGTVRLWDVNTGEQLRTLRRRMRGVNSVSFGPDGSMLASGSDDGTVRLWDVNTGEHKQKLTGDRHAVTSVSFSPDGSTLASGSGDGTVLLWEVAD